MKKQEYLLTSVKNALQILRSFSSEQYEKKTSDLARELGLGKSTVSRLLSTLASEGFVKKNPKTKGYRLGFSILELSHLVTSNMELREEASYFLSKLVEKIDETAHLMLLHDKEVLYFHTVESNQPVRIMTSVGDREPLHVSAAGKIFLAYSDELCTTYVKDQLTFFTPNTITEPEELLKDLHQIRNNGYSLSCEEFLPGVSSIAAPVFDYRQNVIAVISILGPVQRINKATFDHYISDVKEAATNMSTQFGYTLTMVDQVT